MPGYPPMGAMQPQTVAPQPPMHQMMQHHAAAQGMSPEMIQEQQKVRVVF